MKEFISPILFGIIVGLLVYISILEVIVWPTILVLVFHFGVACLLAYLIFGRVTKK